MRIRNPSPLRYPGGKASIAGVLEAVIYANGLQGCTYVEPFAGGAGAGLKLLRDGHVDRIIINDRDRSVWSFWESVMNRPEEFAERIRKVPLTIEEWRNQRAIYRAPGRQSRLNVGFAAFYLNRCNRSGIIKNGGPIGGIEQTGKWKIDARFNREALVERIEEIAGFGDRIQILCEDAKTLLGEMKKHTAGDKCFVYADPPYFIKGSELYLSHYAYEDHAELAATIRKESSMSWVMTYDDVPEIRNLYAGLQIFGFNLRYSAHHDSRQGGEVLIAPSKVTIPSKAVDMLKSRTEEASERL